MSKTDEPKTIGFDKQAKEVKALTPLEREALKLRATLDDHGKPLSYDEIAERLFDGTKSRQTVYDMIKRAERKMWRLDARKRFQENPGDCPIDETPLPARVRHSLKEAGFQKLGQLAGKSRVELWHIEGVGRHGSHQLFALLAAWGVRKPHSFCVNCGTPLSKKLANDVKVTCSSCGATIEVQVTQAEVQPVEATA